MSSLSCTRDRGAVPNPLRRSGFHPYRVHEKNFSIDGFWERYAQIKANLATCRDLDKFDEYRRFVDHLRAATDIHLVPVKDLISTRKGSGKTVALRFDVDMEPLAAVRLAQYNARYGIPSSFYLLHTAYYYGVMQDKEFYRNPLLQEWIRSLIVSGCEIGLHTDAFHLYLEHSVDGAMAIVEELKWLRSQGAIICGTAGHNSYPAYNAENFEIFRNHALWGRRDTSINCRSFPLGVLEEAELDLCYEANYPIPAKTERDPLIERRISEWCQSTDSSSVESESWMRTYLLDNPCFERGFEAVVWHHGGGRWTMATKVNRLLRPNWYWKIGREQMFRVLGKLPRGMRVVFLLHPIYFSIDTRRVE
jgi:hypothetical protein